MKRGLAAVVLALAALPVAASDVFLSQRPEKTGARMVEVATPFTLGRGNFEVMFGFRMAQTVQDGDVHDLWGIDSGADVGIGLAYGIGSRFDVELYRSSFQETFELALKGQVFDQSSGDWGSAGLRAGLDWVAADQVPDSERPFAQLLLARHFGHGVTLTVVPSYVRDTPALRNAFNVPVGLTLPFFGGGLIKLEVVPENGDLEASELGWRMAFSKATTAHLLELTLGNSRGTTVDQILGGDFAGGFEHDDVRVGVNVVRYWRASNRGPGTPTQ
jgi:hypothetical protein